MSSGKNIYFCGSICGGRQDVDFYCFIIDYLKQHHGSVLTERIGNKALTQNDGIPLGKEKGVFDRSMDWLDQADVLVAEVTRPSLGVGFELGCAHMMKKKTLCLYRPENDHCTRLSSMVVGAESDFFTVREYTSTEDLPQIIDSFMVK